VILHRQIAGWLAAAWIGFAIPAQAQFLQQGSKLTASGTAGMAAVGTSVALSADGNTLLVGAPSDSQGAGAAWVYVRANGAWTQQAKLLGSGVSKGIAAQGSSVALSADGNTALVGGTDDNGGTGAMWIFVRSNGVWTQQGPKQWGTVLLGLAHQGVSAALSADGNTAILGGDLDANFTGAAWVFTRTNGTWGLIPDKLVGFGSVGESHQGLSVALSADGNTAIVGGPGDSSGVGAAFVYTRSNGTWTQQGPKLTGAGATANAGVGRSVALSADGNTAMVGGSGDGGNAGAVWVFTRVNNQWVAQGGKLTGSDAVASRLLGTSVALTADGNTALVGGPGGTPNLFGRTPSVGATWVFTRSGPVWGQQSRLVGTGTANNDALQGTAVAVSGDGGTAAIGGPVDNGGIGAAWIFGRPLTTPPVILIQPAAQTIASGQTAVFSVSAIGAGPLSYQWFQGARGDISTPVGLNASTLTTPVLAASSNFWVRVTNAFGSADSNAAAAIVPVPGPLISRVTNAASHLPAIAPNTWVEIDGTNLSTTTRQWATADFVNDQMPTRLDGVSVTVNGKNAFIAYISPTQLNILTPPDSMAGNVTVQVTNGGLPGSVFLAPAQPETPSFFVFGLGPYAAATHGDGSYLGPATLYPGVTTPAKPGETVVLYGTGFGATTPPVVSGSAVQSGILATPPAIQIGGMPATVLFAGLVAPGEFQFNVVVPPNAPAGDNTVTALHNGLVTQGGVLLRVEP
jgi:uncharacterized protein (TIGR03437 family)